MHSLQERLVAVVLAMVPMVLVMVPTVLVMVPVILVMVLLVPELVLGACLNVKGEGWIEKGESNLGDN